MREPQLTHDNAFIGKKSQKSLKWAAPTWAMGLAQRREFEGAKPH